MITCNLIPHLIEYNTNFVQEFGLHCEVIFILNERDELSVNIRNTLCRL